MAELTRMQRNKELHAEINREIIAKQRLQNDKSAIGGVFERLKKIDEKYFTNKLKEFDRKHQIEKPYLDKDRSKNLIPEEIKYEIRRYINELDKIKVKDFIEPIVGKIEFSEDKVSYEAISAKYKEYERRLAESDAIFQRRIDDLREKTKTRQPFGADMPMNILQSIRSVDTRSTYQMLLEVSNRILTTQNELYRRVRKMQQKRTLSWMKWFLPLIFIISIVSIIIPIFIG